MKFDKANQLTLRCWAFSSAGRAALCWRLLADVLVTSMSGRGWWTGRALLKRTCAKPMAKWRHVLTRGNLYDSVRACHRFACVLWQHARPISPPYSVHARRWQYCASQRRRAWIKPLTLALGWIKDSPWLYQCKARDLDAWIEVSFIGPNKRDIVMIMYRLKEHCRTAIGYFIWISF